MYPPEVRFVTKIYHPNFDRLCKFSFDISIDAWSAVMIMIPVLLGILDIMNDTNYEDTLDSTIRDWHEARDGVIKLLGVVLLYACS